MLPPSHTHALTLQTHPFETARAIKDTERKREQAVEKKEWERRERGNKRVNGFFVIKELVYFQACQSNRQETQPDITPSVYLTLFFSPSLPK